MKTEEQLAAVTRMKTAADLGLTEEQLAAQIKVGRELLTEILAEECKLCGAPATRYMDHGADGVVLFCDDHADAEVEPLACAPLAGVVLYAANLDPDAADGGEERLTTLDGFIAANSDPIDGCAFDAAALAALRALGPGETYTDASTGGLWTLRRLT